MRNTVKSHKAEHAGKQVYNLPFDLTQLYQNRH